MDITADGRVGIQDMAALLDDWGTSRARSDLNKDGVVNLHDLSVLLSAWGTCPPAPNPHVVVRVRATGASKLFVDVDPNRGNGFWTFQVQKKSASRWTPAKTYKTQGSAETRTIDLPKGRYRVVVRAKYGFLGSTSTRVSLKR